MPPESRKDLDESRSAQFARMMDIQLRGAEHKRSLLEIAKRILAFCEIHQAKIKVEGGTLLFANREDVDAYNDLITQLKREVDEENSISKEDDERRRALVAKMRAMN